MKRTITVLLMLAVAVGCTKQTPQEKQLRTIAQRRNPNVNTNQPPPFTNTCNSCPITNYPWGGTTVFMLDTSKMTTTNGPLDTNHFYALSRSPAVEGPFQWFTNVVGGFKLTLPADTNRCEFYRAEQLPEFVVWSHRTNFTQLLYAKETTNSWGWTNDGPGTVVDVWGNHVISYFGKFGDSGSGTGTVHVPWPSLSGIYRFGVVFSVFPTNQYPIYIQSGFLQNTNPGL
jgi:hypothetical protein